MIINFSVKNFGCIKDKITLSFEATSSNYLEEYYIVEPKKGLKLLKLGLIYGPNASGKTNILRALDFLRFIILKPFDKKTKIFNFTPFLFDENTPNSNTFFSIEFFSQGVKYHYNVELNKNAIIFETLYFHNPNKALLFERHTKINTQLTEIKFGSKIKIPKKYKIALETNTLWNNTVLGGFLKTNFECEELQIATQWFENNLKAIVEPRNDFMGFISGKIEQGEIDKKNVIEILKKADLKIEDIIFEEKEINVDEKLLKFLLSTPLTKDEINQIKNEKKLNVKEVKFRHKIGEKSFDLDYSYESAGTKRYYQLAGLLDLIIRNEIIVPIDEIESSLHPDLIKHFLLTFLVNSKNSQLIATTHFRELLMEKNIFRNDVIWFTEKKVDGSTDLYSLADFDSSVVRNTSSIYNAYKIGKLGAIPNLDDYYLDIHNGS